MATVATEPGVTSIATPSQASTSQIPNRPKTIPARGTRKGGGDEAEDTEEEEDEDEEYGGMGMEQLVLRVDAFLTGSGDPERNKERIRQLAENAVAHGPPTLETAQATAVQWGDGFTFTPARIQADEDFVRNQPGTNRLQGAAVERWHELNDSPGGRLNVERVETFLSKDNTEFNRMMALAQPGGGVPIMVPEGFVPNGTNGGPLPRLSQATQTAGGALRKMVHKGFHLPLLCLIMTVVVARALVPNMHISPSMWAIKDKADEGRNCNNCSNGGTAEGNQPLNSDWLREEARRLWGPIRNPTLEMVIDMINTFTAKAIADGHGNRPIHLHKMDISSAYSKLTFCANDVHLMGCELPGDLIAFFTGGTFGWGGMPFAFDVVTRAVQWELNEGTQHRLHGMSLMYVDDVIGIAFADEVALDQAIITRLVEGLLGAGAISVKKTMVEVGGVLEVIGYRIDRGMRRAGISENNVHKAFQAVWAIEHGPTNSRRMLQRVASHASRYKRVCPLMAPFTRILHGACKSHLMRT